MNAYDHTHNYTGLVPITERDKWTRWKLKFISISCNFIIICVHIVKYLPKLMLCWKFHLILVRNSQDMDHWNIYLQFWGHMLLGDSSNKWTCAKYKNRNIRNFGFDIEYFHSVFQKIIFYFCYNSSTMLWKNSGHDKFYYMTLWNRHL